MKELKNIKKKLILFLGRQDTTQERTHIN